MTYNFFYNYFQNLPVDLKIKIFLMIEYWKYPKPIYNISDYVEFTSDNKEKYLLGDNSFIIKNTGIQFKKYGSNPFAKMYVNNIFKWDIKKRMWIYELKYGKNLDILCYSYENDIIKIR